MHHDSKKKFYDNFYFMFPICDRKKFRIFQLLENFKKKINKMLMVMLLRPVAKDRPCTM